MTALALATVPLQALKERNHLAEDVVDDVILGVVDPVGEAGSDIARFAALKAGLGETVPGIQISRFCASGLDAVNFAAATDYMQLFGLVAFGFMWARMAKVALDKIAAGSATSYLTTKLVTGRFFMERMLPETTVHLARIQTGSATTMELAAEAF